MIYEFPVPQITDTKNLKNVFGNKKFLTPESLKELDKVNEQRSMFKQIRKSLKIYKNTDKIPEKTIEEMNYYADHVTELNTIFDKDYPIKKNWKWTPFFSADKILKVSKSVKYGKSFEIIMARYTAFSADLLQVNTELSFIRTYFTHTEGESINADQNFSVIKQVDPTVAKLKLSVEAVQVNYVRAWTSLKKDSDKLATSFQALSLYEKNYLELRGVGVEVALSLTQINANVLQVEYLRRQANYGEIGRYAKAIVSLARKLESYIKPYETTIHVDIVQFVKISMRLYKSIALWSLLDPFMAKIKSQTYGAGESINVLAPACCSFVDEIGKMHKEIKDMTRVEQSPFYGAVMHYFTRIIIPKSTEVTKMYGLVYKDCVYDEKYFSEMEEKDYITSVTS